MSNTRHSDFPDAFLEMATSFFLQQFIFQMLGRHIIVTEIKVVRGRRTSKYQKQTPGG
jgi:hypothetical protein